MAPPRRREEVERENFLQAFEKPTQIYRYLRTRNLLSPIFLHRNLNYMSQRMSRTHKRRSTFKVDSLLAVKERANKAACSCFGNNMTIMFQGYFDRFQSTAQTTTNTAQPPVAAAGGAPTTTTTATGTATIATSGSHLTSNNTTNHNNNYVKSTAKIRLEILLLKIAQKKRKDSSSTSIRQIGVVELPQNPSEQSWEANAAKFPTVSLNTDWLDPADGPVTQIVVFRTQPVVPIKQDEQHYSSELMIFDKMGRCLLTDGEYQLSLQEAIVTATSPTATKNGCSPKKYASWENLSLFHSDSSGFEDQFEKNPIIKFQLHWTEQPYSGDYERFSGVKKEGVKVEKEENNTVGHVNGNSSSTSVALRKKTDLMAGHEIFGVPTADLRIAFHFVHNNVSHQTTEQTNSMDCPWCSLNCLSLYSLLKHLKLCHARFAFNFVQSGTTARIEVSINELFDGSYAGAPHNYLTTPLAGYAFSRSGPVRRTSVTHVQVCRPRRLKPSLAEFMETDEALEMNGTAGCGAGGIDRPYLTGHNRLYHHTMTCLPVHPKELDVDSEEECDPPWLKQKTMMMIDEFTDVNEGEKELMKMWNLHVMRHGFVGDCQTALACEMFVDLHGGELLAKNLYRNFVVHMCSMFDYGLVSSEAFHKVVQKLQRSLNESTDAKRVIYDARGQHREHWNTVGYEKYQQQQEEKQREEAKMKEEKEKEKKNGEKQGGGSSTGLKKKAGGEETILTAEGASKTMTPCSVTITRSSRELFQKPKAGPAAVTVKEQDSTKSAKGGGGGGGDAGGSSSGSNKKKTGSSGNGAGGGGNKSSAENPNKRKLERETSPARRRSADLTGMDNGVEKRARLEMTRRKSIAVIESSTLTATSKGMRTLTTTTVQTTKSKTRLSLSLSGNAKGAKEAKK